MEDLDREELEERLKGWQSMSRWDHLMTGIFGFKRPGSLKDRILGKLGID